MNKTEYLNELQRRLSGLPKEDMMERLSFYNETIEDRIEDGWTEEEAISQIGTVDEVMAQIMSEIPLSKLVRERVKQRRGMQAWEIVLLVVLSPIWVSLLIAILVALISIYFSVWALILTAYLIAGSTFLGVLMSVFGAFHLLRFGNPAGVGFAIGGALLMAGITILMFVIIGIVTKSYIGLTKHLLTKAKGMLLGKEETVYEI